MCACASEAAAIHVNWKIMEKNYNIHIARHKQIFVSVTWNLHSCVCTLECASMCGTSIRAHTWIFFTCGRNIAVSQCCICNYNGNNKENVQQEYCASIVASIALFDDLIIIEEICFTRKNSQKCSFSCHMIKSWLSHSLNGKVLHFGSNIITNIYINLNLTTKKKVPSLCGDQWLLQCLALCR